MSFLSYLGDLTARFHMVLGHQLALLVFCVSGCSPRCFRRRFGDHLHGCFLVICAIFVLHWIVFVPLVQVGPRVMSSCGSLVCLI